MALFSNTLPILRQALASAVGDLLYGQCGTSGATTTKIYAPFLWKADDYYNDHNYEVYVYAGTNIGVTKRITDWDLGTFLATVHSAYGAACDATSYIELSRIFTEDEKRKALNRVIEFLADDYMLDGATVTTTLATTTYEYAMPTSTNEFQYVHRITRETAAAGGVYADANIVDPDFYKFILVGTASYIKFDERKYKIPAGDNGKDLRIEGQRRQVTLSSDTSTCYLPFDWLIAKAITYLPTNKIESEKLTKTFELASAFVANVPLRGAYPKSKRVIL
ncbi:hypothetical protein LCGC14_2414450 [marine sediment metagenome]|uniref:Uncharacterized protein n=1 Tax=marine sediment metagenome TaxID=412755 RepID=A0A0F9E3P2_9ZZZZ